MDLIRPYTLKDKDGTEIDFICLTMIDPASSWFELVELPVTTDAIFPYDSQGRKGTKTHNNTKLPYFDKSSVMISNLVNKTWFSHYPHCQYIIYDNGIEFKRHDKALCESFGIIHPVLALDASKSPVGSNMYILYLNKHNIEFTKNVYIMD